MSKGFEQPISHDDVLTISGNICEFAGLLERWETASESASENAEK